MENKRKYSILQKGAISLSLIGLGVLIVSAVALPLISKYVGTRRVTRQRAETCYERASCKTETYSVNDCGEHCVSPKSCGCTGHDSDLNEIYQCCDNRRLCPDTGVCVSGEGGCPAGKAYDSGYRCSETDKICCAPAPTATPTLPPAPAPTSTPTPICSGSCYLAGRDPTAQWGCGSGRPPLNEYGCYDAGFGPNSGCAIDYEVKDTSDCLAIGRKCVCQANWWCTESSKPAGCTCCSLSPTPTPTAGSVPSPTPDPHCTCNYARKSVSDDTTRESCNPEGVCFQNPGVPFSYYTLRWSEIETKCYQYVYFCDNRGVPLEGNCSCSINQTTQRRFSNREECLGVNEVFSSCRVAASGVAASIYRWTADGKCLRDDYNCTSVLPTATPTATATPTVPVVCTWCASQTECTACGGTPSEDYGYCSVATDGCCTGCPVNPTATPTIAAVLYHNVDHPVQDRSYSSPFDFSGWTIWKNGQKVQKVVFYMDLPKGQVGPYGEALTDQFSRPDLCNLNPINLYCRAGWKWRFNPALVNNGPHKVYVYAYDANRGYVGEPIVRDFTVAVSTTPTPTGSPCICSASNPAKDLRTTACYGQAVLGDFELWRQEFLGIRSTKLRDFNCDNLITLADFEFWRRAFVSH